MTNNLQQLSRDVPAVLVMLTALMYESNAEVKDLNDAGFFPPEADIIKSTYSQKGLYDYIASESSPLFGLEIIEPPKRRSKDYEGQEKSMIVSLFPDIYEITVNYDSWSGIDDVYPGGIRKGKLVPRKVVEFVAE